MALLATTKTINILPRSKYISVNTVIESIVSYRWEIWTADCWLEEKLLRASVDFWRRAARTASQLKVSSQRKKGEQHNFGKTDEKYVEMVWTRSTHEG